MQMIVSPQKHCMDLNDVMSSCIIKFADNDHIGSPHKGDY